jgi:hypothetical protein
VDLALSPKNKSYLWNYSKLELESQ